MKLTLALVSFVSLGAATFHGLDEAANTISPDKRDSLMSRDTPRGTSIELS